MTDLTPQHVAAELRKAIGSLSYAMRRQRSQQGVGDQGISLLSRLYREGPQSPTELAAAQAVQPQSLTRRLAALIDAGLVRKVADEDDARRVSIDITPAGIAVLDGDAKARTARLSELVAQTTTEEERALLLRSAVLMERITQRWALEFELERAEAEARRP